MSDTTAGAAGLEARQSMIRVWMALSAVWVGFWLLIAAIVLATVEMRYPLAHELGPFSAIVLTPPLALFIIGVTARLICGYLIRAFRPQQRSR